MTRKIEKAQVSFPSDTEVRVTRDFAAPRTLVWQAHTDPKLVTRWIPKLGSMTCLYFSA